MEKMILKPYIAQNTKINYRWSADLNANGEIINLSEENRGKHIHDHEVGADF